ncbi:hypothetical protein A4A58_22960 [Tardiphaga robiniae]|uniref:Uncharacterized protein n=1 Tax=Tardiphaga robiniae TaxID=943830 RepID=A0A161SSL0_9BRAD|nr:hypothetical protein A4A58_22960 [Tardiphaga robiniae]
MVYAVERGICKFLLEGFASLAGWDASTGTWARSIRLPKIPTRENWSAMSAWIAFAAAMPEVQPLQWYFFNLAIAYAR